MKQHGGDCLCVRDLGHPHVPPRGVSKTVQNSPKQPYRVKPKIFEIEGSNIVTKPLRGNETAWWRLPVPKGPRTPPCAFLKGLKTAQNSPKQSYRVKPKVFEIEGSNIVTKPLRGNETAWWRLPVPKGPRTPPCTFPKGPKNSPKTTLSHKTQSF